MSMLYDFEELGGLISPSTEAVVIENNQNLANTNCRQYNDEFSTSSAYVVNAGCHTSIDPLKSHIHGKYDEYAGYFFNGHYFSRTKLTKINQLYYPYQIN